MTEKPKQETMSPSNYLLSQEPELVRSYAGLIKGTQPMLNNSMMIAYKKALGDACRTLKLKEDEMKEKEANDAL